MATEGHLSSKELKCSKCGIIKIVDDFYPRKDRKRRYQSQCKKCSQKAREIYRKDGRRSVARKKHYQLKKVRDWPSVCARSRTRFLKYQHGLTATEYDSLVESQHGLCLICGMEPNGKWKNLTVDHNHKTGKFRGLLCNKCNVGLGKFRDNRDLLFSAAMYLTARS